MVKFYFIIVYYYLINTYCSKYQDFMMEASKKKIIQDSDFIITQIKGDSQIKTFSKLINSSFNDLQNIIKTISTFKELHKKSQQQYDNQVRTYLTSNYFQMKLVSSKEYLQTQKELKQILQKVIKVKQQTQNDQYTQKTKQNQIILSLTQNIKNCSDLIEKSKNLISLQKSRNDIESESKKKCIQHLDQQKEYLNDYVNNLVKFAQSNQINSQTEIQIKEKDGKKYDEKSEKLSWINIHEILKNLFDLMSISKSTTYSNIYKIQNLLFYKELKQNIKIMFDQTQKLIASEITVEKTIKHHTFMLNCVMSSQKKIEGLQEYKNKFYTLDQQTTKHLDQIKNQMKTVKENLCKVMNEITSQKQFLVIIQSTAQIDFFLQQILIKYQKTQNIGKKQAWVPLADLMNLSQKCSLIERKIVKIIDMKQEQEEKIQRPKKQIKESKQNREQFQKDDETHRQQSTVVQCFHTKQEMEKIIETKLSEHNKLMYDQIDKLNRQFEVKIKEFETKVNQKDAKIEELTQKNNEFNAKIKEFKTKVTEVVLVSLSNQIAGKRDEWNELTIKVKLLNECVEKLKSEEKSLQNLINDKKSQVEKLEKQSASKSQRISNQHDSCNLIKKTQQQQKIQCVQQLLNVNQTNSQVIDTQSQQERYQQPEVNDQSLSLPSQNKPLSCEPIIQKQLEWNQSQQIKSLSSQEQHTSVLTVTEKQQSNQSKLQQDQKRILQEKQQKQVTGENQKQKQQQKQQGKVNQIDVLNVQLQQTVTVIEKQLRGMIIKKKQNWLYKHFQMGVKEEKKKKKQFEQKNYLAIKQGSVKQLQMVNMIDQMNEFIESLASETYSELLIAKIQLLKLEMEIKKNIQHQQNLGLNYFEEVLKLMEKMENQSFNQQNELKQKIQQLIGNQMQEGYKKKIAEGQARYKIDIENQIKIKDKKINELNQQLQKASSSLKIESQKLNTLNAELESKKQQIYQIQNKIQKNSLQSNKRFKQEKEKLEGSIKQKDQKVKGLQYELQTQRLKITGLQKQHQKLKNNNNDTSSQLQATFQQNDKLKRSLQDTKRELNTIKNSFTFKESEINKFKNQVNKINSTIQSLQQHISDKQVTITKLNKQLSTKNQQISTLTNSINQIKSQSTAKISSLTKQLSSLNFQLKDIESDFNQYKQQKQLKTVDFTQTNSQIQKLHQQLRRFLQISEMHKGEQQTNQNTIKSLTQISQSNTQTINSLQNEKQNLTIQLKKLNQNFIKIKTQNQKKLHQLNLQSNHLSTLFECQKGKNQANQKQITGLNESVKTLTDEKTKHQLENQKMKIQIQNLAREQKELKQNLKKKENEIEVNMIDFDEKLSKQQKINAQNSVKIKSLTDQVTQQKNMIEVRDTQIRGLKENCKLMGNHIITLQKVQTQKEKLDVYVIELNKKIKDLQSQCDKYSRKITQINESNSQLQTKLYAKIQRLKGREIQMKDFFEIQKSQFRKCVQELKTQILQKDDKIKALSAKILSEEDEIGKLQKQVQSSKSNEADLLSQLQKIKCQRQARSIENFKKIKQKEKHIQDVQDQLAAAKFRITRLESRLKDNPLKVSQIIQVKENQKQQKTIQ